MRHLHILHTFGFCSGSAMIAPEVKIPPKAYQKALDLSDVYSADVWVSLVDLFYRSKCHPLSADDSIYLSPPGYTVTERNTDTQPIPMMRGKITLGRLYALAQCGLITKPTGGRLSDPGLSDFIPKLFFNEGYKL